jgi:hypothetical protein
VRNVGMEMREKHEKFDEKLAISDGAKCKWKCSASDLKQSSKRKPVNFPMAMHSNSLVGTLKLFMSGIPMNE